MNNTLDFIGETTPEVIPTWLDKKLINSKANRKSLGGLVPTLFTIPRLLPSMHSNISIALKNQAEKSRKSDLKVKKIRPNPPKRSDLKNKKSDLKKNKN